MRAFLDELRAAVSGLMQAPAFTALAVGVLGLGLGAVIFMYGVADTMMLKPPPYPKGDRIYSVVVIDGQEPGDYDDSMLPLDYLKVREAQTQFEAFGSVYVGTTYLTGDGQAERYDGGFADGYIFAVPGVAPEIGRTIEPRDTIPGAARVIVLGHELWTERFGADPAVLGRTVRVNGQSSEVIGVMPKDYAFPPTGDLWVANQERPDASACKGRKAVDLNVFGRLTKDGNVDVAQQELAPVAAQIKTEVGADAFNGRFELKPFTEHWIGDDTKLIWTMLIAVGFVLLIACANVSNLLLARSAYRVRETTVRSALGASRGRLVAHMLAEGFVISALATVLGLLLASIALDGIELVVKRMEDDTRGGGPSTSTIRVTIVAVAAAFVSTLLAGLPAAWRASRPSLDSLLRDGGRMGTGLAIGRIAWGLVVFEVALACLLLGLSALMTKGVLSATSSELGVETADIMTARVGLTADTYPEEADQSRFWETLLERIQSQPGVKARPPRTRCRVPTGDGPVSVEGRDYGDDGSRPLTKVPWSAPLFSRLSVSAPYRAGCSRTVIGWIRCR